LQNYLQSSLPWREGVSPILSKAEGGRGIPVPNHPHLTSPFEGEEQQGLVTLLVGLSVSFEFGIFAMDYATNYISSSEIESQQLKRRKSKERLAY
jgi:hypothetical protein